MLADDWRIALDDAAVADADWDRLGATEVGRGAESSNAEARVRRG